MEKEEKRISFEEDIDFVKQLVDNLEELSPKLEKNYQEKNPEKFNEIKRAMKKIQEKIAEVV